VNPITGEELGPWAYGFTVVAAALPVVSGHTVARIVGKGADEVLEVGVVAARKEVASTRHVILDSADNGGYMVLLDDGSAYIGKGGTARARKSARRVSRLQDSPVDDIAHWPEPDDATGFAKEAELIESVGGVDAPGLLNKINSPGKSP
jgi:hypothetical protein